MAPPAGTLRVGRYFLALLAAFAVLYLIAFWPGQRHTPKLGLDLVGGAQVVYQAKGPTPPRSSMNEARDIMEQRVNGSGVANAEVVIQGSNQIVVSIPGKNVTDLQDLGQAAKLNFRPVVMPAVPFTPAASTSSSATPSASTSTTKSLDPLKGLKFAIPTSEAEYDKLTTAQQQQLQTALANFDCTSKNKPPDLVNQTLIACDEPVGTSPPTQIYLLGPVIVAGNQISSASAVAPNLTSGQTQWTVSLNLKPSGQTAWAKYTGAHHSTQSPNIPPVSSCGASTAPCAEYVAFTLDGSVVSAPHNEAAINGGATQISGSFTQSSAEKLAQQLKYGALPLDFTTLTSQNVSASLGTAQLKAGLLAGGIGLILVVVYSLIYYRALGLVTIASLLVSGGLTYACLVILGKQIGFTLTLAGIAGFIVAVGITADSFVVFFERIKDEVHEGRSMRVAVPRAWVRARRTILSADTVSFLAAAVLYYFAAGGREGLRVHPGAVDDPRPGRGLPVHPPDRLAAVAQQGVRLGPFQRAERRARGWRRGERRCARHVRPGAPRQAAARRHRRGDLVGGRSGPRAGAGGAEPAVEPDTGHDRRRTARRSRPSHADDAAAETTAPEHAPAVPQPGTAAERAAARRARLRAEASARKGGELMSIFRRLYRGETRFEFIGTRRRWYLASAIIIAICIISFVFRGFNCGRRIQGRDAVPDPRPEHLDHDHQADKAFSDAGVAPADAARMVGSGSTRQIVIKTQTLQLDQQSTLETKVAADLGIAKSSITVQTVSSSWGHDITVKAIQGLIVFLIIGLDLHLDPVPMEDGGRRHRRLAARPHPRRRRVLARGIRGHAVDRGRVC